MTIISTTTLIDTRVNLDGSIVHDKTSTSLDIANKTGTRHLSSSIGRLTCAIVVLGEVDVNVLRGLCTSATLGYRVITLYIHECFDTFAVVNTTVSIRTVPLEGVRVLLLILQLCAFREACKKDRTEQKKTLHDAAARLRARKRKKG